MLSTNLRARPKARPTLLSLLLMASAALAACADASDRAGDDTTSGADEAVAAAPEGGADEAAPAVPGPPGGEGDEGGLGAAAAAAVGGACNPAEGHAFADQTCANCGGYKHRLFVDGAAGDDDNAGTEAKPLKSINAALAVAKPDTSIQIKALPSTVGGGAYTECVNFGLTNNKGLSFTAPIRLTRWGSTNPTLRGSGKCDIVGSANTLRDGFLVIERLTVRGGGDTRNGIFVYGRQADPNKFDYADWVVIRNNIVEDANEDGIKLTALNKAFVLGNVVRRWARRSDAEAVDHVAVLNGVTAGNTLTDGNGRGGVVYKGGSLDSCVVDNTIHTNLQHAVRLGSTTLPQFITPEGRAGKYEAKGLAARGNKLSSAQSAVLLSGCDGCEVKSNQLSGARQDLKDVRFQNSVADDETGASRTWFTRNARVTSNCSSDATAVECSNATGGGNNVCTPNGGGC
jgi:hypothetical protein